MTKPSLYNKLKGKSDWVLPELIKLCELAKEIESDTIEIRVGESDYLIQIEKKTPETESTDME